MIVLILLICSKAVFFLLNNISRFLNRVLYALSEVGAGTWCLHNSQGTKLSLRFLDAQNTIEPRLSIYNARFLLEAHVYL